MTQEIIHSFLILLLIIPMIFLVITLYKKLYHLSYKNNPNAQLIYQLTLSKKEKIVVVSVENVKLIIGISPNHFNLLHLIKQNDI